ncbi:hypothetical protein SDC9_167174 [bioreactor metagenome]|uniref:Uncharacterized protein n=1 Tax=bioreactor metagenome TaxID=1076179 RepID=A0A645G1J3_9ZZZZ
MGISVKSISTPMSPRATITPSETARISSMFCTPSLFSILAIILMLSRLWESSNSRMSSTSRAQRVNEAAIKSNPFSMPNTMSASSCLLRYGMERRTPGTLTLLWFETYPLFCTLQVMSCPSTFSTTIEISPSSSKRRVPGSTSCGRSR